MSVSRRRLFQSLALAAASTPPAKSAEPAIPLEVLRNISLAHGTNLTDGRLRALKPVLERRIPQLRPLRDFEFDDTVAPTNGIL